MLNISEDLVQQSHCDVISLGNYSKLENQTKFTYDQFLDYTQLYSDIQCSLSKPMTDAGLWSFMICGVIGFFAYILMLATLKNLAINDCTMIYHRAMVCMELVHMIIMAVSGATRVFRNNLPNSWILMVWMNPLGAGWTIGDALKLAVSTLAGFLTLERFIAVWLPILFRKINRSQVAYCAVVASMFLGTPFFWQSGKYKIFYDQKSQEYVSMTTWFANDPFMIFLDNFVLIWKMVLSLIIFALNIATVIGLQIQSRKMSFMSTNDRKDLKAKRKACALSYILGLSTLFDHVAWVLFRVTLAWMGAHSSGTPAILRHTYEEALFNLGVTRFYAILEFVQRVLGEFVHSYRFFVYLAVNQTMRDGFRKLICGRNEVAPVTTQQM